MRQLLGRSATTRRRASGNSRVLPQHRVGVVRADQHQIRPPAPPTHSLSEISEALAIAPV